MGILQEKTKTRKFKIKLVSRENTGEKEPEENWNAAFQQELK